MMVRLELGMGLPVSPECYRNFLSGAYDRRYDHNPRPVTIWRVNQVLREEGHRAVMRRRQRTSEWYLEFPSKAELTLFKLRWG